MSTRWQGCFKRAFWPLIWIGGLAMIFYYAPYGYQILSLADGEQVVGFRGQSHDLMIVGDGPTKAERKRWTPEEREKWAAPHVGITDFRAILGSSMHAYLHRDFLPFGHSVFLWNLDGGLKERLALVAGHHFWNRRLKPLIHDVSEPLEKERPAQGQI